LLWRTVVHITQPIRMLASYLIVITPALIIIFTIMRILIVGRVRGSRPPASAAGISARLRPTAEVGHDVGLRGGPLEP